MEANGITKAPTSVPDVSVPAEEDPKRARIEQAKEEDLGAAAVSSTDTTSTVSAVGEKIPDSPAAHSFPCGDCRKPDCAHCGPHYAPVQASAPAVPSSPLA